MARCSLLCGSYFGILCNDMIFNAYAFLENQAANQAHIPLAHIVILTLLLQASSGSADCNVNQVIKSDLKACEQLTDGSKLCKVFTTAEVTLPTIASESCIYFTNTEDVHLFSLRIKLDSVTCSFSTKRMYYTFPVTAKHISQVSCIYNEFCGKGIHCIKQRIGKGGLRFESETEESRQHVGESACVQGVNAGCFILTRSACNFYRTWYEPDLLNSYEVSQITSHSCNYHISVTHIENNTMSQVVLSDSVYLDTGIKITILGAYDQPQLHLSESLIQRVGRPEESYLTSTCQRNVPKAGEVGQIQANQSYTKDFLFDPNLSQCDFFEDRLRCSTVKDPLSDLKNSQEFALPLERDMHLLQIRDGKLISSLLVSSAIRLQLQFQNFKIATQIITVCPQFSDDPFEIKGCYNCPILARITFKAHSTCQTGIVLVQFQEINIYTKAIKISSEVQSHTIKFVGEKKCFNDKLCLKAQTLIQCRRLEFCLEEPTVELINLNTNYTVQSSLPTTSKFWDWFSIPNLDTSLILVKFIGSSLFIICIIITISSTVITCCCRSR